MEKEWTDLVPEGLQKVLLEHLKLPTPTPIQSACLRQITTDNDYLVQAPTGSGKTLAVLLPLLRLLLNSTLNSNFKELRTSTGTAIIVLSPTRELAIQTHALVDSILGRLKPHWMTSVLLCGTSTTNGADKDTKVSPQARKKEKEALRKGQTVVVGTPGRVLDHLQNTAGWRRAECKWLVLDEADRLLDSGFAPKVSEMVKLLNNNLQCNVLYCSATANQVDKAFIELREGAVMIKADTANVPAFLKQEAIVCPSKQRLAVLVGLFRESKRKSVAAVVRTVVFMSNCDSVDYHYELFKKRAVPDTPASLAVFKLHGNLSRDERQEQLSSFASSSDAVVVLFATDVAARGLNLGDHGGVQLIIQYDAPCDRLDYVHRAGRTARGIDAHGRSVIILNESEAEYVEMLRSQHSLTIDLIPVEQVVDWLVRPNGGITVGEEEEKGKRGKFGLWLKRLLENISNHDKKTEDGPTLKDLGQRAYASSIRAYATHPADERHIFHIKRLHLGHLASSFGLEEAVADKQTHQHQHKRVTSGGTARPAGNKDTTWSDKNTPKKRDSRDSDDKPIKPIVKKPKRFISEFSAY